MSEVRTERINDAVWTGKLLTALGWTILCGLVWVAMIVGLGGQEPDPGQTLEQHNQAIGMAGCMVTGCAAGGWLCGLSAILVVFAILRR